MEKIALEGAIFFGESLILTFPIYVIANNRMPDGAEVNPDLVCTAGIDPDLEQ